jgi:hypothetical protein
MKFEGMKAFVQEKATQAAHSVSEFAEREDTKAAVAWTKATINTATDEAVELGRRAAKSEMGKDAATGAGIGAVVAVPIPIIGPIFGAIAGGLAGVAINLAKDGPKKTAPPESKTPTEMPNIDLHKRLTDLDDLRQKGILSQEEFDIEKKKILNR